MTKVKTHPREEEKKKKDEREGRTEKKEQEESEMRWRDMYEGGKELIGVVFLHR